ncbi:hypothetical protein [Rhodoplanes sp. SY1]|uniref:hypothetical protein n=1 Tax=Rhodoplanes sp. SY1 TaxID=3166646 RepID=UPI0038B5BB43
MTPWTPISDEAWAPLWDHVKRAVQADRAPDEAAMRTRVNFAAWNSGALNTGFDSPFTRVSLTRMAEEARDWTARIDTFQRDYLAHHGLAARPIEVTSSSERSPLFVALAVERAQASAVAIDMAEMARSSLVDPEPKPAAKPERDRWMARLVEAWSEAGLPTNNNKALRAFLVAAITAFGGDATDRAARAFLTNAEGGPCEKLSIAEMRMLMGFPK